MFPQPELTPEIEQVLRRYLWVQAELKRLKEERKELQGVLMAHLDDLEGDHWMPVVDGEPLKVRYQRSPEIEYDEELLQRRLGDRYDQILAPDPKKLKRHLPEIAHLLEPALSLVGSPVPEKVRAAIESGSMTLDEFRGAFRKDQRRILAVGRA